MDAIVVEGLEKTYGKDVRARSTDDNIHVDIASSGEVVPAPEAATDQTKRFEEIGYRVVWHLLPPEFPA